MRVLPVFTEPHRNEGKSITEARTVQHRLRFSKTQTRTAPHGGIAQIEKPYRVFSVLCREKPRQSQQSTWYVLSSLGVFLNVHSLSDRVGVVRVFISIPDPSPYELHHRACTVRSTKVPTVHFRCRLHSRHSLGRCQAR